ncbi:hypothetical protein [Nostoc sp.]|uniref:hypothetical protein n=1 Tax=Nostoc sp. TaxID=1180 RepID=UPI002FF988A6
MTKARFHLLIINEVEFHLYYEQHQKRSLVQPGKLTERSLFLTHPTKREGLTYNNNLKAKIK